MKTLTQKQKNELWCLLISVDYDYSRITIADHDLNDNCLSLWLEDSNDFKNTLDECLLLDIPIKFFAKTIEFEKLNSYEGQKMHPKSKFIYKSRIEINKPIEWYNNDASIIEQKWAREKTLLSVLNSLIESEISDIQHTY